MKGWRGGAYAFDGTYTRASSTAVSQYGQGIAAFMLGIPLNGSFIELRPEQDYSVISHGVFVHDDWRVGEKLTLNLGVRYDLELGMTEAENRNVRGFDFTTPNPIQAQAQAQFAANPPAGVPLTAAQFAVLGGYQYVDDANRRIWDADTNNFQPRFGFTYAASPITIVRGGAGLFISPFQINAVPGLGEPREPAGICPSNTGPRDERQRADVSGEPHQSRAERPAPATEWLESWAAHQPRGQLGNPWEPAHGGHHPDRSDEPRVLAVQPWRRAPTRKRLAGRAVLPGAEGLARAHRRAAQLRAAGSTARRIRFVTTRPRRSSARSSRTHFRD